MDCASCGRANRAGAKFCNGCGRPLAARCPACGIGSAPGAQFCDACGASLLATPSGGGAARKIVTIVFADLIGSTALHERLDAESARRFMERYYAAMRGAVEAHGGSVTQLLGDGVKAVFGAPRVAEDDAIRAVRAAVEMQRAFRALADEQLAAVGQTGLRVAVNTGEVIANDETEIIGDPVNVAARLQEEAGDGGVVIGEATRRLVAELVTLAPLGSFSLKGRAEVVAAYRVVSLERPPGAAAIAFVGREDELSRVTAVYDSAVATRAARLAVLLGSPGLGKSRLIDEFTRRVGDAATVLIAHCDAAGGATFAPLAEALRGLLRIDDGSSGDALRAAIEAALSGDEPERARIASGVAALIVGTPASPEEIFFVVRRLLAAFAAARPVVLAIDDIQWAEPLLLDLIEHLVQWGSGVRLLVLAAARPELRDMRSSLATPGGLVSDVVTLAGLDAGAAARLAANVIGAEALPAAIAGRVLATSEGNPLFVGELVRMLVHDGALKREGDRWTTGIALADVEMPPTIHALLAARIERLRPEERTLLERAAVIGRHFSRASLAELLPREIGDLDARLESLRRSELIESDTGWFLGEPALRFHHVLIRDAAYRRLLKNTRAELHGRFADWLESRAAGSVEHDETLGWHLEQAHQHLRELGPIDAPGRALGERAARHLAAAGRRALARDDLALAASLLGRAIERLDAADPARAELALDWCEALLSAGDVAPAAKAIDELGRFLGDSERLRAWHTCFAGQLAVLTDPQALRATADRVAAAAETLTSAGDAAGEAKGHSVHALALARLGKIAAAESALDKALAAARRARDRRRANAVLAGAPLAALWGPSPVTRASGRCLDVVRVLRITEGAPAVEAVALRCQAVLEALRGRADAARRMIASSRRLVEELGITQRLLEADVFAGMIELLEGDAVAAERSLRTAYDGLREQGLGIDAAQAAALLGRALLVQDRAAEAEAISHESEALAGDDFKAAISWRGVRAEALAKRGEHAAALALARAAVELAAATDDLLDHADARVALAAALRAAGRSVESDTEWSRAIALWEAKGATLLVERARRSVSDVEPYRPFDDRTDRARAAPRRVRPNAATATMERFGAAFASRDAGALADLFADGYESLEHPIGAALGHEEVIGSLHALLRSSGPRLRYESLASLGESLVLTRRWWSSEATSGGSFDVAASEREVISVVEVDERARFRWGEIFARDHLGDAISRLYERYAELLPDGPERTRSEATAHSVAELVGPVDPDRWATALAAAVEFTDHRSIGLLGYTKNAESVLRGMRSMLELSADVSTRVDDVLDLRSDSLLLRVTNSGTARAGGGAFERQYLQRFAFGSDGLATRMEWFDADRDAEALAGFDDLTAAPLSVRLAKAPSSVAKGPDRYVRLNAATANAARLEAAVAARDSDALAALHADGMVVINHRTGVEHGREGALFSFQTLLRDRNPWFRNEPLATLGDSLALCRWFLSASGSDLIPDTGTYERDQFSLFEVDGHGRRVQTEVFATEHLGDAITRLYERHAELLPDGPARVRAAAAARSAAAMLGPPELDRLAEAFAPAIETFDARSLGTWAARGAEAALLHFRSLLEVADDIAMREYEILRLEPDALLVRRTHCGTDRASGGAYERRFLMLLAFGADGRITRIQWFDPERCADALARFDALTAEPAAARPASSPSRAAEKRERRVRSNAATASALRTNATIAARDADALPSLLADSSETIDHTTGTTWDREGLLASWRSLLSARDPMLRHEPLASLGDSLALCRLSVSASGFSGRAFDVGAYQREAIVLIEADTQGRSRRSERFAGDRLGAAVARLYERNAELLPDGPARDRAAATARSVAAMAGSLDLDRLATAFAPAIEGIDHRTLGTWSARGAGALLAGFGAVSELSDNIAWSDDAVLGLQSDVLLVRRTRTGTARASGGAYERPFLLLLVFGSDGLLSRIEWFDADRDAEALARFDELTAEPSAERFAKAAARSLDDSLRAIERRHGDVLVDPRARGPRIENAATRFWDRTWELWQQRDWDRITALFPAGFRNIDRQRMMQVEVERDRFFETVRPIFEMSDSPPAKQVLATRGERLALAHFEWAGSSELVGPTEFEWLDILEIDAGGEPVALVSFDPDAREAAYAELDARYHASEAAPHAHVSVGMREFRRAFTERDWDALAARCAPDLVVHDHRLLGWESLHGPAAYLEALRSLVELAPDTRLRIDHASICESGYLVVTVWEGTREGGAYEAPSLMVAELDAADRVRRFDQYDLERLDEAHARFAELRRDPLRIPPNAAARAIDRWQKHCEARDLEAVADLLAPSFVFEDRRRLVRDSGDREKMLASVRVAITSGASLSQTLLATAGDRLALVHQNFSLFDGARQLSEIETLLITEVDTQGSIVATVGFDPDDRRGASIEMYERYFRDEGARFTPPAAIEVVRALNQHDLDRLRAALPDDYYFHDHRRTGVGRIGNADGYVDSLRAVLEQSRDMTTDTLYHVAVAEHGSLGVGRMFGTLIDGGGFETLLIRLSVYRDGRTVGTELFEIEDLDLARARFEALRPDPLRIPPNAATRIFDRWRKAFEARDWPALEALCAPTLVYEDRRRMDLIAGDRDTFLTNSQLLVELSHLRIGRSVLATAGDRLVLEKLLWSSDDGEVEVLQVVEVDAEGRFLALIGFDPDDRRAASAELRDRFVRSDTASWATPAWVEFLRAVGDHDMGRCRAALPTGFVHHDHRRTGFGRFEIDEYLTWLEALFEQSPDAIIEPLYYLASERHGTLAVAHTFGTLAEGGEFESIFVAVGHASGAELFDLEDLDVARARFDALRVELAARPR